MIDVFSEMFTAFAVKLREKHSGIFVTGDLSASPAPRFPCVLIEEYLNTDTQTDNGPDHQYAYLGYEFTIESNKSGSRVTECRSILKTVDEVAQSLNMRRISYSTQSGLYNNSVYRIKATYTVAVDQNHVLYKR